MGALSKVLRAAEGGRLMFWCPGCNEAHVVRDKAAAGTEAGWTYNGNPDKPTFTPSILVRGVGIEGGDAELDRILDEYKLPEDRERVLADKRIATVCHSYVTDGRIQFLSDCTHGLAGQTLDLPPFDNEAT